MRGALGDLLVGEDVEAGVGGLDEGLHVGLGGIDDLRVAGVGVGHAAVVHAERQRLALVVDHADEALVRRVPQQLPAVVAGEGRVVDDVAAVGHAGRVDGVGRRVLGADVVVRALQALQHVGEVGQVLLVERLDQLAGDVAGQPERGRADHEVDLERVVAQVGEELVLGVVGGDLHLRAERRLEGRHRVGVDVVGVVEDLERPRLRLLATGHGLIPLSGSVTGWSKPGQRDARAPTSSRRCSRRRTAASRRGRPGWPAVRIVPRTRVATCQWPRCSSPWA